MNQPPSGQGEPADSNEADDSEAGNNEASNNEAKLGEPAGNSETKLVFISHTHDVDGLQWSLSVAEELEFMHGLEVWLDTQNLMSGDSIQQEVFGWIEQCTDFVSIVTENYFSSQYCQEEAEQAYNRKIQDGIGFHLFRFKVPMEAIPARYSGIYSLEFSENFEESVQQLAAAIKGPREEPQPTASSDQRAGKYASYSTESMLLAKFYCENSVNAVGHETTRGLAELPSEVGMTAEDFTAALEQLSHFFNLGVNVELQATVYPRDSLWAEFDEAFEPGGQPAADALQVAETLLNYEQPLIHLPVLSAILEWEPRRVNPAVRFLLDRGLVEGTGPESLDIWTVQSIMQTSLTVRYIKQQGR